MSVELDPAELGFRRPFTREVTEVLHLRNRNEEPVAFKVKTTAPKQYCVRPNSGRIEPGEHVEIQVLLQAMKEDPPPDAKCRDKFLVQSVSITKDLDSENIANIWSAVEKAGKEGIKERKIRVSFLAAGGGVNGASDSTAPPPPYVDSPNPSSTLGSSLHGAQEFNTPSKGVESSSGIIGSASSAAVAAGSAVSDAAGTTKEALEQQLEAARAKIAQLTEDAKESAGLRQRKGASDPGEKAAGAATAIKPAESAGGVPIQLVAALCLVSFLLAYFFF